MSTWQGRKLCRPYTGRKALLEALYLGRRLTACPRLLNCPALSAQIACPGRLAGTAGNLARPMLVRECEAVGQASLPVKFRQASPPVGIHPVRSSTAKDARRYMAARWLL